MLLIIGTGAAWASEGAPAAESTTGLVAGLVALVLACGAVAGIRRPFGVIVSALAGACIAGWLAYEHGNADAGTLCAVNETWNCQVVNSSRWSEVGGVPIALFGLGAYAALAWLGWQWSQGKGGAVPLIAAISGLAVCFDAFLGYQMMRMGAGCVFCVTTYALNLVILGAAVVELVRDPSSRSGIGGQVGGAVIAGLAVYLIGVFAYRNAGEVETVPGGGGGGGSSRPTNLAALYEQARGTVEYGPTDPVTGNPSARFTLVEWADFQCPHCQFMSDELKELLADPVNQDVKLVYRNYPISNQCNRFVGGPGHTQACLAAAAGECAREQGRFWELSAQMFKNQDYLGKSDIQFMVGQLSLDAAAFEACMAKPETGASVIADIEAGGKAGVTGTPSVYLLGAFGDQWVRLKGDGEEIAAVLAAARAGTPLPAPPPPQDER